MYNVIESDRKRERDKGDRKKLTFLLSVKFPLTHTLPYSQKDFSKVQVRCCCSLLFKALHFSLC